MYISLKAGYNVLKVLYAKGALNCACDICELFFICEIFFLNPHTVQFY